MLDKPNPLAKLEAWAKKQNYAEEMTEDKRQELGSRVIDGYEIDKQSRSAWEEEARLAMDAVLQTTESKSYPFDKAANIKYPLLTTATLQFNARSLAVLVQGDRVVKMKIVGRDPQGLKRARADRVSLHMSYQILKQMDGWETGIDLLLAQLPAIGSGFKKVYWDHEAKKPCSEMISAMNVIVNQNTKSLRNVPRISHEIELYPHEIEERIRGESYIEFDYKTLGGGEGAKDPTETNAGAKDDVDRPHLFIEQHRYEDMDGDGLAEPWIVTVHKESGTVVRVVANIDLKKVKLNSKGKLVQLPRYQYFVHFPFLPDPNGGFYGIGYGRLLRSIGETINTTLNLMIDAAHLQNAGGGFIGSGLDLKKSELKVGLNKWTTVNLLGDDIRKAIIPHNFKGPSPELFNLLGMMIDMGKQIASVQDTLTGEASKATMQPTTLLALIEQGMKVYTSIMKRLFRAMGEEFTLLYMLNQRYPDEEKYQNIVDWEEPMALLQQAAQLEQEGQPIPPELEALLQQPTMQADYADEDCDLVPVADPSASTDMQKMAKAQLLDQLSQHPAIGPTLDAQKVGMRILEAAQIEDAEDLKAAAPQIDPLVQADAEATIQDKKAKAILALAKTEEADAKTEKLRQEAAIEQAEVVSGHRDADAQMSREVQAAQVRKSDAEARVKEHDAAITADMGYRGLEQKDAEGQRNAELKQRDLDIREREGAENAALKHRDTDIKQQIADKPAPKPKAAA